ncbi:glycosyl transferase [Salipaludibacillus sp. CUR1]|uniref:ATP-grasp fold amidoligase family protein n=1 Tax=Salipaludibacillus sp. CUR1 TaxID=2820003 RepID=UPI001E4AADE7|nr:ATP-grasp fold amidoligase family protein [Salipaludibacillus sp. CUR1]MCE7792391.1 glycosyl transferase [Salipaludibacillus sp. CUR1]
MIKRLLLKKMPGISKKISNIKSLYYHKYYSILDENKYPVVLSKIYKKKMNEKLDWNNLRTYNEKMQWAKLYDNNPLKTTLTDKYLVRDWVKEQVGEEYLIPLLGVWNTFDEIDFNELPNEFVLKTNHGTGTNLIVIDKSKLNKLSAKKKFDKWLQINYAFMSGFEMQYKEIKPKIIAEKYLTDNEGELKDYKFLCFNGNVYYCWVNIEKDGELRRNIYDLDWELQPWTQHTIPNSDNPVLKPKNFDLMISIVSKLCKGFSHVRVDLYNVNGKVYFGEMTFTNGSGFKKIHPFKYNVMLGDLWELPVNVTSK